MNESTMSWGGWLLCWGLFLGTWAAFEAGLPTWSWTPHPPDAVSILIPRPVRPLALPPTTPPPSSLQRVARTVFLETRPTYDTLAAFPSAWELHGPTVAWFGMDRLAQRLAQAKGVKALLDEVERGVCGVSKLTQHGPNGDAPSIAFFFPYFLR